MTLSDLEKLITRINLQYEKRRASLLKEIRSVKVSIEYTEKAIQKNQNSYKNQVERTQELRNVPLKKLKAIILNLEKSIVSVRSELKKLQSWLNATRGWIKLYTELQQRKHERWTKDLMLIRQKLRGIEASEEFINLVFGGGPVAAYEMSQKTVFPVTPSKTHVSLRREQMEQMLSVYSVDRIRQIEHTLRVQSTEAKQMDLKPKIPSSLDSHPLGMHERELLETFNRLKAEENSLCDRIEARVAESKELCEKWDVVLNEIQGSFEASDKKYRTVLDNKKWHLENLFEKLDQLNQDEQDELEREIRQFHAFEAKKALLTQELNALTLNQSISRANRFSYFDYRPNYPLLQIISPTVGSTIDNFHLF